MALSNSSRSNSDLDHLPLVSLERIYLLYYARVNNILFLSCYQDVLDALDDIEHWRTNFENYSKCLTKLGCHNTGDGSATSPSPTLSIYIRNAGLLCDNECYERLFELVQARQQSCSQRIVKLVIQENRRAFLHSIPAENLAGLFGISNKYIETLSMESLMLTGNLDETLSESLGRFSNLHTMECLQCMIKNDIFSFTSEPSGSHNAKEEPLMISLSGAISALPRLEHVKVDVSYANHEDDPEKATKALLRTACIFASSSTLRSLSLNGIFLPKADMDDFGQLCRIVNASESLESIALWDTLSIKNFQTFSKLAIQDNAHLKDICLVLEPGVSLSLDCLVKALNSKNQLERIHIGIPSSNNNNDDIYHQPMVSAPVLEGLVQLLQNSNYALREFNINHELLSSAYLEQQQPQQRYGAMASQNSPKLDLWLCKRLDFYLHLNRYFPLRKQLLLDETFSAGKMVDSLILLMNNTDGQNKMHDEKTTISSTTKLSMVYSVLTTKPSLWVS